MSETKLRVSGVCNTSARRAVIEDAIAAIQADPVTALTLEFMGVKDYAGFVDQRCDCKYGYGPRHGCIVFRVGRAYPGDKSSLGEDDIAFLLRARGFPGVEIDDDRPGRRGTRLIGISAAMERAERLESEAARIRAALGQSVLA